MKYEFELIGLNRKIRNKKIEKVAMNIVFFGMIFVVGYQLFWIY